MNDPEIKIGDRIYIKNRGRITKVETVTKITPTLIRSQDETYSKSPFRIRGYNSVWDSVEAYLETPELIEQWEEIGLRQWMAGVYYKIPVDDIKKIKAKMERVSNE